MNFCQIFPFFIKNIVFNKICNFRQKIPISGENTSVGSNPTSVTNDINFNAKMSVTVKISGLGESFFLHTDLKSRLRHDVNPAYICTTIVPESKKYFVSKTFGPNERKIDEKKIKS